MKSQKLSPLADMAKNLPSESSLLKNLVLPPDQCVQADRSLVAYFTSSCCTGRLFMTDNLNYKNNLLPYEKCALTKAQISLHIGVVRSGYFLSIYRII